MTVIPAEDMRLSCSFFFASQTFTFAGSLTAEVAAIHSSAASASPAVTGAAVLGLTASH